MSFSTLKNPHLSEMKTDYLYHLNIDVTDTQNTSDIQQRFGDIKVICAGGTAQRMRDLAIYLQPIFGITGKPVDLCESGHRYAVFKVGQVLCVSHGVGSSTFSVVLHELLKLVRYAKCKDPVFVRIGTCGGLGIEPGTVVVSKDAYNGYLENVHEIPILGKRVERPASFPQDIIDDILKFGAQSNDGFAIISANTMSTDCFYEGQGRTDGAVCEYTDEDKMNFLKKAYGKGIRNIEMEATMFSSLTQLAGVKAASICVALINRLNGDQVSITMEQKKEFEQRPFVVVERYIKHLLNK
ncbi:uridine phosphorylase 1 [Drosophila hydei]|uniref:Uridine phosphorylase 1 n=1 Tax=Drosophila hydei TaxID=7224 RepID=A0A6J1LJR7_DROHY|nr:uridine phosphorylase 1 [Drosophila hydei]XP_023166042.1 uridine phosphorylase 1 [Drosophila hydei]